MMISPPSHDHEYTELGIHKTIASNISTTMRRGSNPPPQSVSSTVNTTNSFGSKNFDCSSYSGPLQCRPREFDDSKELPEPGRVSAGVKPSPASRPPSGPAPSTMRPIPMPPFTGPFWPSRNSNREWPPMLLTQPCRTMAGPSRTRTPGHCPCASAGGGGIARCSST